jgi:hypothetical protein
MTAKEMWNMKLNETRFNDGIDITRVPGGWIYRFIATIPTAVFVPLDNEFMNKETPK